MIFKKQKKTSTIYIFSIQFAFSSMRQDESNLQNQIQLLILTEAVASKMLRRFNTVAKQWVEPSETGSGS